MRMRRNSVQVFLVFLPTLMAQCWKTLTPWMVSHTAIIPQEATITITYQNLRTEFLFWRFEGSFFHAAQRRFCLSIDIIPHCSFLCLGRHGCAKLSWLAAPSDTALILRLRYVSLHCYKKHQTLQPCYLKHSTYLYTTETLSDKTTNDGIGTFAEWDLFVAQGEERDGGTERNSSMCSRRIILKERLNRTASHVIVEAI